MTAAEDTEPAPSEDATAYLALAYDDAPPTGAAALAYSDVPDADPLPRRQPLAAIADAVRALRAVRPYLAMFAGAVVTATAVMLVAVGGGHPAHRAVDTAPAVAPPAAAAPKEVTPAPKPAVAVDPPPAPATQPEPPRPVKSADTAPAPRQRPPAATDDQYVATLHAHGIGVNADRTTAVQNGRLICSAFDNGLPLGHIEDTVAAQEQGHLSAAAVPVYIRLSVDAYCPEYGFLLPSAR